MRPPYFSGLRRALLTGELHTWNSPRGFSTLLTQPRLRYLLDKDRYYEAIEPKDLSFMSPGWAVIGRGLRNVGCNNASIVKALTRERKAKASNYSLNLAAANHMFTFSHDLNKCGLFIVGRQQLADMEFGSDTESTLDEEAEVISKLPKDKVIFVLAKSKQPGWVRVSNKERKQYCLSYYNIYRRPKAGHLDYVSDELILHADVESKKLDSLYRVCERIRTPAEAVKEFGIDYSDFKWYRVL